MAVERVVRIEVGVGTALDVRTGVGVAVVAGREDEIGALPPPPLKRAGPGIT